MVKSFKFTNKFFEHKLDLATKQAKKDQENDADSMFTMYAALIIAVIFISFYSWRLISGLITNWTYLFITLIIILVLWLIFRMKSKKKR